MFRKNTEHLTPDLFGIQNTLPESMLEKANKSEEYHWTYEELFKNICFNILVKIALGLDNLTKMPFCPATLFNFQNKLSAHFVKTGENLLEQV